MRNKRTFVGLFVILALLCLGIGYAAISKTLTINGGVGTGDSEDLQDNFIVYFSDVTVDQTTAPDAVVTAEVDPSEKSLTTSFKIENMNVVDSKIILTYTIKNDSTDLYANGPKIKFNNTEFPYGSGIPVGEVYLEDPHFTVTIVSTEDSRGIHHQIVPGQTHQVIVTIEMTNCPLDTVEYSFNITLLYEAGTMAYTS